MRKLEPLARMLAGRSAWITGLRREQSRRARRSAASTTATTERPHQVQPAGRLDLGRRLALHRHQQRAATTRCTTSSIPSIGCAPCTRAIAVGEDFRAGRWWWEDEAAKECGLHVKQDDTQAKRASA